MLRTRLFSRFRACTNFEIPLVMEHREVRSLLMTVVIDRNTLLSYSRCIPILVAESARG